ncbi:MAG: acylneuraminate cytidylyltransferase family protein [Verrucomicrobiota bacterium]
MIPARGGSKALPGKNIKRLAGKPLIQYSHECANESGVLDRVILSTDDEEIAEVARSFGLEVPFLRPSEFSGDDAPMAGVAIHALTSLAEADYRPDALLLLQPTSPLRKPEHIRRAVELLEDYDSVCSVVPLPKEFNPYYMMKITDDGFLDYLMPEGANLTRRQDIPNAYRRDGTICLVRTEVMLEQRNFYGQRCRPYELEASEVLNIDTPEDWKRAEEVFAHADPAR